MSTPISDDFEDIMEMIHERSEGLEPGEAAELFMELQEEIGKHRVEYEDEAKARAKEVGPGAAKVKAVKVKAKAKGVRRSR